MDRQTLVAFYFDGRTLLEMSDQFHSPVGTIKRRLHVGPAAAGRGVGVAGPGVKEGDLGILKGTEDHALGDKVPDAIPMQPQNHLAKKRSSPAWGTGRRRSRGGNTPTRGGATRNRMVTAA